MEIEKVFKDLSSNTGKRRRSFNSISEKFENKLKEFNPTKNYVKINEYFGKGLGNVKAVEKIISDEIIKKEDLEVKRKKDGDFKYLDFKGLYIFLHKEEPFYVGISRSVVNRILQHIKTGKSHYSASLAYKIACYKLELEGKDMNFTRSELDYGEFIQPVQERLLDQNIALLPISDDEEMYLFEVYCSLHFDTTLNKFATT